MEGAQTICGQHALLSNCINVLRAVKNEAILSVRSVSLSSISILLQNLSSDGRVPCGTGIAPLGMVISLTVFQGMALGEIIKVNVYGLFQSFDLPGVRLSLSQGRQTKAIYG